MAHSDFSLTKLKQNFDLTEVRTNLFPGLKIIKPKARLKTILKISFPLAITASSEKARSEFIVAPLLLELMLLNKQKFTIFSGERLDVAPEQGLNGASLFNQKEHNQSPIMYGCVTTGEILQFLKLIDKTFYIDSKHYYISELGKLIAILQTIIDT